VVRIIELLCALLNKKGWKKKERESKSSSFFFHPFLSLAGPVESASPQSRSSLHQAHLFIK